MKKIIFTIAAVCCIALTSSCTKEILASYSLDASGINYPSSQQSVANAFGDECSQVARSFDGTSFTQDQFVTAIGVVVDKYNHKYLDGPFKILKDGAVIKTFQMLMNVGYDNSGLYANTGKEDEITNFSNAVQAVVNKYHNNEYSSISVCMDEIQNVVTEYNYKDIQGPFNVWVGDSSTIVKEFTLHFAL